MKKYLALISGIFTALFFSSCTKNFDCECTETYTYTDGSGQTETTSSTSTVTIKETTRDVARRNCLGYEYTDTYTYGNSTYSYTYARDCELK